jgi:hypothetical protein
MARPRTGIAGRAAPDQQWCEERKPRSGAGGAQAPQALLRVWREIRMRRIVDLSADYPCYDSGQSLPDLPRGEK